MGLTHKSQSALEYLMTYGWAILIIVIVAGALYSLGIFNPSASAGTTITGFNGLGSPTALCMSNGGLRLQLGNNMGNTINVTRINITSNGAIQTVRPNQTISSGGTYIFYVPNVCGNIAGARYSFTSSVTYTEPSQVFGGSYISSGTASGTVSSTVLPGEVAFFNNYAHFIYSWGCGGWCLNADLSYINVTQSITGTNASYTVAMWVESSTPFGTYPPAPNSSGISGAQEPFSGFASDTGVDGQEVSGSTGNLFLHRCSSADTGLNPPNPVPNFFDGHWHFIAYSVSATQYIGMVDGLTGAVAGTKQYADGAKFLIGGFQSCFPAPFTGYISNVQLYSTALSSAQLTSLYQEGILGKPLTGGPVLVGWWPLNGTVNGKAQDYSGHSFNGQLHDTSITSNYVSGPFGG